MRITWLVPRPRSPHLLRVGGEEPEEGVPVQVHQLNVVCGDVDHGDGDCGVVSVLHAQLLQHREQPSALVAPRRVCKPRATLRPQPTSKLPETLARS